MKKALFLLLTLGLFACSSPEDLITEHLKNTLDDWSSYEPVSFGEIEHAYVNDTLSPLFKAYRKKAGYFLEETQKYYPGSSEYSRLTDSVIFYQDKWCAIMRPEGWRMIHTYRSSNTVGAKTIKTRWFFLDEDKKKIIRVDTLAFGKDGELLHLGKDGSVSRYDS